MSLTRRDALAAGAAALGVARITPGAALAQNEEVPTIATRPPALQPEKGATLRVVRPSALIEPDERVWRENTRRYTDTTGVAVNVEFVVWENVRARVAEIAGKHDGADIALGFGADPQMYAGRIVDLTDVATYLGMKYIGWCQLSAIYGRKWGTSNWIGIPVGGGASATVYRKSWLQDAGYDQVPDSLDGFLNLCQQLQKIGHPCGFSLGPAPGDADGYASWLLWAHNAMMVDERGKVALDSKQTIAALKYAAELQKTMVPGTLGWTDTDNNKAFMAGRIGLTFNGVSIYYAVKTSADPVLQAIGADTAHQVIPKGFAPQAPILPAPMTGMVFDHTAYPNAAKDYLRFMMEAEQYVPWLTACIGYWSHSLRAYGKLRFWSQDPQLQPFALAMETPYYDGYRGPVGAASSAVTANHVIVDMFAAVAKGSATPEAAAKHAAERVAAYYGGS